MIKEFNFLISLIIYLCYSNFYETALVYVIAHFSRWACTQTDDDDVIMVAWPFQGTWSSVSKSKPTWNQRVRFHWGVVQISISTFGFIEASRRFQEMCCKSELRNGYDLEYTSKRLPFTILLESFTYKYCWKKSNLCTIHTKTVFVSWHVFRTWQYIVMNCTVISL